MSAIKVIIAEDEDLLREMLISKLSAYPDVEIVGDAPNGEQAIELAERVEPEVVLTDIEMGPGVNGIQAGKIIKSAAPTTGIVLLSSHKDKEFLSTILEGGAAGWSYLLKKNVRDADTLVRAIKGSAWGLVVVDPELTDELTAREDSPLGRLNEEQIKILQLLVHGHPDSAIAAKLNSAEPTIKDQLTAIYRALGIALDGEGDPRVKAVVAYLDQTRLR